MKQFPIRQSLMLAAVGLIGAAVFVAEAPADVTLSILKANPANPPIPPGSPVAMKIRMSNIIGPQQAAGFQAFISYKPNQLTFNSGSYTAAPFGLHILNPIFATPTGTIDVASGIDQLNGQAPTSANADLVTLNFTVLTGCGVRSLIFRPHVPPTRVTDPTGQPIKPLLLQGAAASLCMPDIAPPGGDKQVDVNDLLILVGGWGPCPPAAACCLPDLNGDGTVDVNDLLLLIGAWGAC